MLASDASLLDRMIARLTTQRAYIEHASALIQAVDGPVLEIGLGKGRTYSHLRKLMPGRNIIAFDRDLHAPPNARPAPDNLVLGEFDATLTAAINRLGRTVALAHADFGSPDIDRDARQAEWLGPLLERLVRPGGIIVSDRRLDVAGWRALGDEMSHTWRYFMWRAEA